MSHCNEPYNISQLQVRKVKNDYQGYHKNKPNPESSLEGLQFSRNVKQV